MEYTHYERRLLQLLQHNRSVTEMAAAVELSERLVQVQLMVLSRKLGGMTVAEALHNLHRAP